MTHGDSNLELGGNKDSIIIGARQNECVENDITVESKSWYTVEYVAILGRQCHTPIAGNDLSVVLAIEDKKERRM